MAPLGLLAELTHRCPLACPYCSNPLQLDGQQHELTASEWSRIFLDAAGMGVLQLHLSGGEPLACRDIVEITAAARAAGLYSNLITSGIGLTSARLDALKEAGLDHVQVSIQDVEAAVGDRIAGYEGAHARKQQVARIVVAAGLPLTINAVIHRSNLARLPQMVALAASLGASRIELAHAQYHGWALRNRSSLMISREDAMAAVETIEALRHEFAGIVSIDSVLPDYHGRRPKACMGGWGQRALNVTPSGRVLPCHAAETIPGLRFPSVREQSLAEIWTSSEAFNAFRGQDWMQEPCRSCPHKAEDFGGCRCQALALTGSVTATDPACEFSPHHPEIQALAAAEAVGQPAFTYRDRA